MRRSSRYQTRSSASRAPNSGAVGGPTIVVPERRSERARSQTERLGISSQVAHEQDYSRLASHAHHHQSSTSSHPHYHTMYRGHPQSGMHMMSNGSMTMSNMQLNSHSMSNQQHQMYRQQSSGYPSFSMPMINDVTMRRGEVRFLKLNSYEDVKVLIKTRSINQGGITVFQVNDVATFLSDDHYRIFLRFCKFSNSSSEQNDCLPKSFNLCINNTAFQVKNKYTFAPYDITTRVACEKNNDVLLKIALDSNSSEMSEDFYYGLFLVKKVDHKRLLANFKTRNPFDIKVTLDLVKRKLNPGDDSDDIAILENADQIKISLLCPLSATRIKVPARSRFCDHVHCFDAESFININEITPRWKCPICKIYIKLDDMIIDSLFLNILREAPPDVTEADIFEDGRFEYIQEGKPNVTSIKSITSSSTSTSVKPHSSSGKRKFEDDAASSSANNKSSNNNKAQKKDDDIECITIDDSDDDSNDETITSTHSDSSQDSSDSNDDTRNVLNGKVKEDSDSDSDIEIIFEKIAPPKPTSSSRSNHKGHSSNSNSKSTSSTPNSNSNLSSHGSSSNYSLLPTASSSSSSLSMPSFNSSNTSCMYSSSRYDPSTVDSHQTHPAYVSAATSSSLSNGGHQTSHSQDMMNMFSMYKYQGSMNGNGNSYSTAGSTSSYCNGQNSSNLTSYFPTHNSNPYSTSGASSTISHSLLSSSARPNQSLLRYPQSTYMNPYSSSQLPSTSSHTLFGSSTTSHTPNVDLTSTLANLKSDPMPNEFDQINEPYQSWFNHSAKDVPDYNYLSKTSRVPSQRSAETESSAVDSSLSLFPNFHLSS